MNIFRTYFAGFLVGFGLGIGAPFIILASLLVGKNLYVEIMDSISPHWRKRFRECHEQTI